VIFNINHAEIENLLGEVAQKKVLLHWKSLKD